MADLDVSDVLEDPDFYTGGLLLLRGGAPLDQPSATFEAVVDPSGGRDLVQTPEGERVRGQLALITRQDLTAGDAALPADIVVFRTLPYRVLKAMPYPYGSGFTHAVLALASFNPGGPAGENEPDALNP